jgi:hypothetical protein
MRKFISFSLVPADYLFLCDLQVALSYHMFFTMPRVINSGINSPFELLSGNVIFKTFPHFSDVAVYTLCRRCVYLRYTSGIFTYI